MAMTMINDVMNVSLSNEAFETRTTLPFFLNNVKYRVYNSPVEGSLRTNQLPWNVGIELCSSNLASRWPQMQASWVNGWLFGS